MKDIILKNGETCRIRRMEKADAQALLDYFATVCGETDFLSFGPGEFGINLEQEEEFIEEQGKQKNCLSLLAEVQGKIIATLNFRGGKRPRMVHVGDFGICVSREYWGYGIGAALIQTLIDWSREAGIRKINLGVRTDNACAIHLYKKLGFKEEGISEREQCVDGIFYDCILMGMKID